MYITAPPGSLIRTPDNTSKINSVSNPTTPTSPIVEWKPESRSPLIQRARAEEAANAKRMQAYSDKKTKQLNNELLRMSYNQQPIDFEELKDLIKVAPQGIDITNLMHVMQLLIQEGLEFNKMLNEENIVQSQSSHQNIKLTGNDFQHYSKEYFADRETFAREMAMIAFYRRPDITIDTAKDREILEYLTKVEAAIETLKLRRSVYINHWSSAVNNTIKGIRIFIQAYNQQLQIAITAREQQAEAASSRLDLSVEMGKELTGVGVLTEARLSPNKRVNKGLDTAKGRKRRRTLNFDKPTEAIDSQHGDIPEEQKSSQVELDTTMHADRFTENGTYILLSQEGVTQLYGESDAAKEDDAKNTLDLAELLGAPELKELFVEDEQATSPFPKAKPQSSDAVLAGIEGIYKPQAIAPLTDDLPKNKRQPLSLRLRMTT